MKIRSVENNNHLFSQSTRPSFSRATIGKVTTVFLTSLLLLSVCVFPALALAVPRAAQGDACLAPHSHFPAHLGHVVHPGLMSNVKGDANCEIPEGKMIDQKHCDDLIDSMRGEVKNAYPQVYRSLVVDRRNPETGLPLGEDTKGYGILIAEPGSAIKTITFGSSPKMLQNYQKLLNYLENHVLADTGFFERPAEEIVSAIKKSHQIVLAHLPGAGEVRRKGVPIVTPPKVGSSLEQFEKALKGKGGNKSEIAELRSFYMKVGKQRFDELTAGERRTFQKIGGHLAAMPQDIEPRLSALANELKERFPKAMESEKEAIRLAADVHQEIVGIHPFYDGNGRVARAWMNTVLEATGVGSVIIPDDNAYTDAIVADQKKSGAFVAYLTKIIKLQQ